MVSQAAAAVTESLRVAGFSTTDGPGGAARAALRIHGAVRAVGVESTLHVSRRTAADPSVVGPRGAVGKAAALVRPRLGRLPLRWSRTTSEAKRSPALLPSLRVRRLNQSDVDLCHLHWVADEMLSVEDIGRIQKPVVWTLHDMWAFSGAEHLAWDDRYREGYRRSNRAPGESGLDVNRWTWLRKRRSWARPMQIVTPSRWLAECVRASALMGDWPVEVIPNPVDLEAWQPIDKAAARGILGIPPEARVVAFGSMGDNLAHHKGGDLLGAALTALRDRGTDVELLIFGEDGSAPGVTTAARTHHAGILSDEVSMRLVYSAADALVIPSRLDNLPNTGVEALACGTPLVAFRACGLSDMVVHEETGYLARPFDPADLASGIAWVAGDAARAASLGRNGRAFAEARFAAPSVGALYRALYEQVIDRTRLRRPRAAVADTT
jgi:glycosyltransferase involved in cell wall biosynthesis